MSSKTILVDLRLHSRTKKKYQAQSGISKDQLRAAFGGKYWDRGWAIQTALRPASSEGNFSRWRPVVVDPDTQPDGIPSLIRHLQEGFSIIVMDSVAAYEESPRRGVIEELQKRLPGLVVGPVE